MSENQQPKDLEEYMLHISLPSKDKHDSVQNRIRRREAIRFCLMSGPSDKLPDPDGTIVKINLEGAGALLAKQCAVSMPADVMVSWPCGSSLPWENFMLPGMQALEKIDNGETVVVEYSDGRQLEWKWHKEL